MAILVEVQLQSLQPLLQALNLAVGTDGFDACASGYEFEFRKKVANPVEIRVCDPIEVEKPNTVNRYNLLCHLQLVRLFY
jgi:hypothetical protein